MFVVIAATRKGAGPEGVGSVNAEPRSRPCSPAKPLDTVAHPPARSRAFASARLPSRS